MERDSCGYMNVHSKASLEAAWFRGLGIEGLGIMMNEPEFHREVGSIAASPRFIVPLKHIEHGA